MPHGHPNKLHWDCIICKEQNLKELGNHLGEHTIFLWKIFKVKTMIEIQGLLGLKILMQKRYDIIRNVKKLNKYEKTSIILQRVFGDQ